MKMCMSRLSKILTKTGRLIGISIFGKDRFLTYVIKMAYKDMMFGNSLEECLEGIKERYVRVIKANVS